MNKLFGFFLLAIAFLPGGAEAANCFWVGGTGTWDGTNTGGGGSGGIKWASATGGSSACAGGGTGGSPTAADTATFDANSGGGTVTVNTTVNLVSLSAGAFTGTLTFAANNNNVNVTSFIAFGGTGTRTIDMGSGTWTITGSSGTIWACFPTTNLTATFNNATITFAGASGQRAFDGGGATYGAFTVANNSSKGTVLISQTNTFASITMGTGNTLVIPTNATTTVSGAVNITGTSSAQSGLTNSSPGSTTVGTLSVGSASTCDWCGILGITKSGAGSITATNSLDMGRNTSVTITAPSGAGGGGRIIGG